MTQAALAVTEPAPAGAPNETGQYLTFVLAGDVYAIDILNIRELIEYGNLTAVPMMPDYIAGVMNLRGSVVPVIDLATRFGAQTTEIGKRTSIAVVEVSDGEAASELGIVVDQVNEVVDIMASEIEPAPAFGARIRADFIAGMGKIDGRFLILLDVDNVLSIDELSLVGDLREDVHAPKAKDDAGEGTPVPVQ